MSGPNALGQRSYNDPGTTESSIGPQIRTDYFQKKALIEAKKEMYFSQLADVTAMPKNMGKTIKRFHYLPILDDANINDQGIDAAGTPIDGGVPAGYKATVKAAPNAAAFNIASGDYKDALFFVAENAVSATAVTAAEAAAAAYFAEIGLTDLAGAISAGWRVTSTGGNETAIPPVPYGGNLYGSSKDPGVIVSKLPTLSEHGGRVNRVGMKRIEIVGTIDKFGFFDEYTQESLDFDSDNELQMHINREMVYAANEMNEAMIQIDLLNGAGINRYAGDAIQLSEMDGEDAALADTDIVAYGDFVRLAVDLDNNRTPKHTKMITGTRMIDTKVINGARVMYIGSELLPTLKAMTDYHDDKAFIEVQHYAAAGTILNGEVGSIDQFRLVVVPEMAEFVGAGNVATTNPHNMYQTAGQYDVFPMLVVGDSSFTTIGFQTNGKTVKFSITHKAPGKENATHQDPYGEIGFMSIKWYYGTMILRPERIAVMYTLAVM